MPHLPRPERLKTRRHTTTRRPHGQQKFYHTRQWGEHSKWYRSTPQGCICAVCRVDVTPGDRKGVADHVIRLEDGGAQYDERNLMALCKKCHDRKTGMESHGKFAGLEYTLNKYEERIPTPDARQEVVDQLSQARGAFE